MKKLGGQQDLVEGNLPELEDVEMAEKLEEIWKLRESAKKHDKLLKEVKEFISGWILGLPKKEQGIGQFKCGDFVLTFKVENKEVKTVEYKTTGGKKVKVKFAPEDEEE